MKHTVLYSCPLGKTDIKTFTVPLSTQEYKWVPANCQGNLAKCWEYPDRRRALKKIHRKPSIVEPTTTTIVICTLSCLLINIQWNPDFSNPRFPEPPDTSNQTLFPLDFLHSSSIISPPISRTLDFSKLPITRTNFGSRGTN